MYTDGQSKEHVAGTVVNECEWECECEPCAISEVSWYQFDFLSNRMER